MHNSALKNCNLFFETIVRFNNPDMKNLYSEDDINYAKKLKWKLS